MLGHGTKQAQTGHLPGQSLRGAVATRTAKEKGKNLPAWRLGELAGVPVDEAGLLATSSYKKFHNREGDPELGAYELTWETSHTIELSEGFPTGVGALPAPKQRA